jgi:putative phosphoesterase
MQSSFRSPSGGNVLPDKKMKVAVLADIHGNIEALETVAAHIEGWGADAVVVAGDVINRGPLPRVCLDFLRQKQHSDGWLVVRGNHEDYVLDQARPDAPRSGPLFEISRNAYWTYQKLDGQIDSLQAMPFQVSITGPDNSEMRVVHASMRSNRDGLYPESSDAELRLKIEPAPVVLCGGHTHRPLIRKVDETLVVNVGAVGIPFDGDSRACYAQVTQNNRLWQAKIIRLEYDRVKTEQDYFSSGFISGAGPMASLMLVEFRQSRSHIHRLIHNYEKEILAGEITMVEAVNRYLASNDLVGLSEVR